MCWSHSHCSWGRECSPHRLPRRHIRRLAQACARAAHEQEGAAQRCFELCNRPTRGRPAHITHDCDEEYVICVRTKSPMRPNILAPNGRTRKRRIGCEGGGKRAVSFCPAERTASSKDGASVS